MDYLLQCLVIKESQSEESGEMKALVTTRESTREESGEMDLCIIYL